MQYIKIHSQDNVAVALADMTSGSVVTIDNDTVTLSQDVVRGHKFALRAIAKGENVIKYGLPIGHALADIRDPSGGHHCRYGTAEACQQRHCGSSGKSGFFHDAIQREGGDIHEPAVFKYAQLQEQQRYCRNEGKHAACSCTYTVCHQADEGRVHTGTDHAGS